MLAYQVSMASSSFQKHDDAIFEKHGNQFEIENM